MFLAVGGSGGSNLVMCILEVECLVCLHYGSQAACSDQAFTSQYTSRIDIFSLVILTRIPG